MSETKSASSTVTGRNLALGIDEHDCFLAGRWLNTFHHSCGERNEAVFLFGDYVAAHLYIDCEKKEVKVTDPGKNFGKIGAVEGDAVRFVVGLLHTRKIDLGSVRKRLRRFVHDIDQLDSFIEFRIIRSFEKALELSAGAKNLLTACLWFLIVKIKFSFIKKHLTESFYGN
jgi:hypothetical protein